MQTFFGAARTRLALILALSAVASCAVAPANTNAPHYWNSVVNKWEGREAIDLWRTWGVPTKIVKAPNGNEMHVYIGSTITKSGGSSFFETSGISVGKSTSSAACETDFEVDASKVIIGSIWRGEACPATEKQPRPKWLAAVPIGF